MAVVRRGRVPRRILDAHRVRDRARHPRRPERLSHLLYQYPAPATAAPGAEGHRASRLGRTSVSSDRDPAPAGQDRRARRGGRRGDRRHRGLGGMAHVPNARPPGAVRHPRSDLWNGRRILRLHAARAVPAVRVVDRLARRGPCRGGDRILSDLAPLAMRGVWVVPRGVRAHLSILLGVLVLVQAAGLWLQTYGLLLMQRGVVFGAGYADMHAALPALRVLSVLAAATGLLLMVSPRMRSFRPAAGALAGLVVLWIAGVQFYPGFVQQFNVAPNELRRETPYIQHNIAATLHAYGLDAVEEKAFPASTTLDPATVVANQSVLDNVRLWDDRPLLRTYTQLQSLRLYYTFSSIGIDRYRIAGREQQVMLAARELDVSRLPPDARTWVNEHLVFTHGYGLVMNPVNRFTAEGLPEFYVKNIPPQSVMGEPVSRPELYYGLTAAPYVVVKTRTRELDYAAGDRNVYADYTGSGGVPIGGSLSRLAFTYRFGALPLSLNTDITPASRIMFHRAVPERVAHIAPFLTFDHDPYLVVAGGRLFWIIDGYTTTAAYPYAQPTGQLNYIRNSVKAVVDAYDGSTRFYVADASDPLIATYARIFPGVFAPLSEMPRALAAHIRYPVDLFTVQAQIYATFHMTDPQVFYNREDMWAVPNEAFAGAAQPLEPYYVDLRLTPRGRDEFTLILPFTPSGKDNMVAWMAAR